MEQGIKLPGLQAAGRASLASAALVVAAAMLGVAGTCGAQTLLRQPVALGGTVAANAAASQLRTEPMRGELLPANSVEAALKNLADQAAVIFAGSVARVTEEPAGARVEFAVEEGLRGTATGGTYTMKVSAWGGGVERYRVGERALFLLLAPSAQGFSSPVGGELGIVPLTGDAVAGNVDLRWVATTVQRTVNGGEGDAATAAVTAAVMTHAMSAGPSMTAQQGAHVSYAQVGVVHGASVREQMAMSNVTGADVHAIDRGLVTGMLRAWSAAESHGGVR